MKKQIITLIAVSAIIFSACKKESTSINYLVPGVNDYSVIVNGKIVTVRNLDADTILGIGAQGPYGAGKYSFFSLATNSRISNTDSATSNWDLAFAGTTIRVNCGTSGPGTGGAFVYPLAFEEILSVPTDSSFKTDNYPSYAITKGSGKGWYTYDGQSTLVNAIPGRTLVIRTANGKYAKVEIINYYKGGVTPLSTATDSIKAYDSRYYSFRYTYQADGSTTF